MKLLTDKQELILGHIMDSVGVRGYPPTTRELMRMSGRSSPSVCSCLANLEVLAYIKRGKNPREIKVLKNAEGEDVSLWFFTVKNG